MLLSTISHQASQIADSETGHVDVSDMHLSCSVFLDAEEGIFLDILPCAETMNSDLYIQTLKTLQKQFRWGQSHKNVVGILLQHDNVEPHTSLRAQEAITKFQRTAFAHPKHIPNFAPSDIWSPQRCHLWEKTRCDDEVIKEVKKYMTASTIFTLVQEGDGSLAPCRH